MAVTITPVASVCQLQVAGDIEARLQVPAAQEATEADGWAWTETYYIALSDGTLIKAANSQEPAYEVVREGAGAVRIEGWRLTVDWSIEWITLSPITNATRWKSKPREAAPLQVGDLAAAAA